MGEDHCEGYKCTKTNVPLFENTPPGGHDGETYFYCADCFVRDLLNNEQIQALKAAIERNEKNG